MANDRDKKMRDTIETRVIRMGLLSRPHRPGLRLDPSGNLIELRDSPNGHSVHGLTPVLSRTLEILDDRGFRFGTIANPIGNEGPNIHSDRGDSHQLCHSQDLHLRSWLVRGQ